MTPIDAMCAAAHIREGFGCMTDAELEAACAAAREVNMTIRMQEYGTTY